MTMQTDVQCSQILSLDISGGSMSSIAPLKDLNGNNVGRCRIKGVYISVAGSPSTYNFTFLRIYDGNPVSVSAPVTLKKYDSLTYSNGLNPNIGYQLIPGEGILVDTPYIVLDAGGATSPTINCYVTIFYG
jgi:hypothetical protein